jgi:hypothetical protein
VRQTYIDTYRSLSDIELLRLLQQPQSDFRPEARVVLVRVATERGLDMVQINQSRHALTGAEERHSVAESIRWNLIAKQEKEQPHEERDQLPRRATEFDIRYMGLKETDQTIQELKNTGRDDVETRTRIEELVSASMRGWHELYIDIINREG